MSELTAGELRKILNYSSETGLFTWIKASGTRGAGSIAGSENKKGYVQICIRKTPYRAHRLAWMYVNGAMPAFDIDHINGVRNDNKISNLRLATPSQNQHNTSKSKNNRSGYKGVYFNKRDKKFVAQIMVNRKRVAIGYYLSADEAHKAYQKASLMLHGEFARSI
ncbi:HNH endonuclease [Yersinia rochesterensis]|uniref:HNH endonuclease n=1 Tax=Yersinia rochesterensis TaxID=1604335 RepID=UPI001643E21C|nr:HNH endonuclease [Yersinia rochesterensis]